MKAPIYIRNIYLLSALGLFVYLILRAIYVPPVHDEASTFMHYIQRNEWMPYKAHWDANNHVLNSFLSSLVFKIFGYGLLQLRLASLLFFPLYAVYVFRIGGFLRSNITRIGFFLGMLGVHSLMEYFAYSRGYGMSMALLMAAVFYLLQYLKNFELRKLWPFYLFAFLALFANLTLFNSMVILNGILILSFLMKNKKWLTKVLYTIVGLVPLLLAALISMEMKKRGLLYYGADKSFYHVTMASLSLLIYGDWFTWLANSFFVIAGLGIILLLCGGISEGFKNLLFTSRWVFGLLLFGNVIATVLLQKLMHVNYPEDRTAMYFYFCLILFFCFATDHVEWKPARYLALILLVAPIHFVQRANITHSTYWWYEHLPRSFYAEVEKRAGNVPTSVSIGGYNLMDMIWAYYNHSTGGRLNGMQVSDYPSFYYDYLVLYNDDNCKQAMKDYNLIMESPYSELRLLERKNKIKLNHITTYTVPDRINDRNEFLEFYSSDSLNRYANICFDVEMDVQNTDPFLFASMVVQNFIEDQKTGPQETQELHLLRSQWKKGYKFHQRIYVRGISPNSNRTVSYLWNPRHQAISLTNTQVSIYYWED